MRQNRTMKLKIQRKQKKKSPLIIILSLIFFCFILTTSYAETSTKTNPPAEAPTLTTPPAEASTLTTPPAEAPTLTTPPAEAPTLTTPPAEAPTLTTPPAESPTLTTPPAEAPTLTTPPAEAPTLTTPLAEAPPLTTPLAEAPPLTTPLAEAPPLTTPPAEAPIEEIAAPYRAPISLPTMSALSGNPGDIFLRKTANQIPVACRTYNVTLGVSGNPVAGTGNVDVVIVIDKSLSMSNDMNASANIAKQLVFLINDYTGNQVGIVSFNSSATKHEVGGSYFSSGKTNWNSILNGLSSGGASNIASGITAAHEILKTSSRYGNPNVSQSIIVLSDGIASTTLTGNPTDAYVASDYNIAKYNAVTSAQSAANDNMKIFGVNLSATTSTLEKPYGVQTMTAIGIDGYINIQSYSGDPKTDGNLIYDAISTTIYAAATNSILTDTIDPRFEFVSFVSYDGSVAPTTSTIGTKQVISWNIGPVYLEEKTLTYSLRAKSGVQGIVPTNESAYLTFTPATGSTETSPKYFPVPDVYVAAPLAVTLTDALIVIGTSITLGTGTNPSGGNYMAVTGGWYVDSAIMALYPGRLLSTIPQVLTYKWYLASDINMITPINPTVTLAKDTQFRVRVTDAYGCIATATMWVRPRGNLTITKNITGTTNPNQTFVFEIKQFSNVNKTNLVKTFYETIRISDIVNNRVVIDLPQGYYEVKEKTNWSWQYDAIGSTTVGDTLGMNANGSENVNKAEAYTTFTDQSKIINWLTSIDWVNNTFTGGGP
jgi:hypothetical protein